MAFEIEGVTDWVKHALTHIFQVNKFHIDIFTVSDAWKTVDCVCVCCLGLIHILLM